MKTELTRRAALAAFAAAVYGVADGTAVARPRGRLGRSELATFRALDDALRGPSDAVSRLHRELRRRDARFSAWVGSVLVTLERAPDGRAFTALSRHERRRVLEAWWVRRDPLDHTVMRLRAADAGAPESLRASTSATAARIRAHQAAGGGPPAATVPAPAGTPLGTEVRRLRHLRGAAADLLQAVR